MKLLAIAIVLTLLGGCTARESDDIVKLRLTQEFAKDERTFHECADWARESLGEDATAPEYMELTNSCLHMQTKLRASEADVEKKEQELEAAKRELQEARRQVEDTKGKLESERQRELAETKRELEEEKRKREAAERARQENNTSQSAPVIVVPTPAQAPQTGGQEDAAKLWQAYQEWEKIHVKMTEILPAYSAAQYAEAMPLAKRALYLAEKLHGYKPEANAEFASPGDFLRRDVDSPDYFLVWSLRNLAHSHFVLALGHQDPNEFLSAVTLYQRVIEVQEKNLGKYHPDVLNSLEKLAWVHESQGEYYSALPLLRRVVDTRKIAGGLAVPLFGAEEEYYDEIRRAIDMESSLEALAEVYSALNDHSSALPVYREWIDLRRKINRRSARQYPDEHDGEDGVRVEKALTGLAQARSALGQYKEAVSAYHGAIEIYEKEYGDPAYGLREELAEVYVNMGDYSSATQLYRRTLVLLEKEWGENVPGVVYWLNKLAMVHRKQGDDLSALPLYRRALAILEEGWGKDDPDTKTARENLAQTYERMGEKAKAAAVRAGKSPD